MLLTLIIIWWQNTFCRTNNSKHGGSRFYVQKDIVNILRSIYFANFHSHVRYRIFFGVFMCRGFNCRTSTKPQYVMWYNFLPRDAKVTSQHDHAIRYVLYHEGKQHTYCKYFDLLLWFLLITEYGYHIT
jgi:hypothetical protein